MNREKTFTNNLILIMLSLVAVVLVLFDFEIVSLILAFLMVSALVVRNLNDIRWGYILLIV